jgi:DNA-binding NtrC family response regulator
MMSIAFAEFETATQSERFVPRSNQTQPTLLHALVVAEDAERCEFFHQQAREAGWEVTVCGNANTASNAAARFRHSLVIVDLAGTEPGSASNLRGLKEQLSSDAQRLLVVCGAEGNPLEEIWARQLGVWLYLAGVNPTCDVTSLCLEAKQAAEKLTRAREPAYARTA